MKQTTPSGMTVEKFDDGSMLITSPSGATLRVDARGNASADIPRIRAVGIADLADVEEHRIATIVGSRSHHVRFRNGSTVSFAYNDRGELLELSAGQGVSVTLTYDDALLFGGRPARPDA